MTEENPRQAKKKNKILRAALETFLEEGFHNAKMKDIALRAQIGKGTIYEYFHSKEDLFTHSVHIGIENLNKAIMEEALMKSSAREQLEAIIQGNIRLLFQFKHLTKLMSLEFFKIENIKKMKDCAQHDPFKERLDCVINIIQKGIRRKEFRPIDPFLAASMVYSCVFGLAHALFFGWSPENNCMDEMTAAEEVIRWIMHGLAAKS
jgi:TetR/AcrR family fatty acid metabolism transcriptional regulator